MSDTEASADDVHEMLGNAFLHGWMDGFFRGVGAMEMTDQDFMHWLQAQIDLQQGIMHDTLVSLQDYLKRWREEKPDEANVHPAKFAANLFATSLAEGRKQE